MRKKGNVRAIDELGRIVVPIEFRVALDIKAGDLLVMDMEGGKIVIEKKVPTCVFCGREDSLVKFGEKSVCTDCIKKLVEM